MKKNNTLIFGASKLGEIAKTLLESSYNIVGYLDNDANKWGTQFCELPVYNVNEINLEDFHIVIASMFSSEIEQQLETLNYFNYEKFCPVVTNYNNKNSLLDNNFNMQYLSLGNLISNLTEALKINQLSFLGGGSTALDYFFLKAMAAKLNIQSYLEIGTWTGESISAVAEVVKECVSVSLPDEILEEDFKNRCGKDNFSRFFSYKNNNIQHYIGDSKAFDFSQLNKPELVFIDGDHSYEGVFLDTKNIFEMVGFEDTVVVWHDFRTPNNKVIGATYNAVKNVIPKEYFKNVYFVTNTLCGVYIPEKFQSLFNYTERENELFSYEVSIKPTKNILE